MVSADPKIFSLGGVDRCANNLIDYSTNHYNAVTVAYKKVAALL